MTNKDLLYADLQEAFTCYLENNRYLEGALDNLKKYECRSFISSILNYEYQNLVEKRELKLDRNEKGILPENLIAILIYDRKYFKGEILNNFINDIKYELEAIEMELYDDPGDFQGGDYWDEDSDCDEDYTLDEWVEDQTMHIRNFLEALEDFIWGKLSSS